MNLPPRPLVKNRVDRIWDPFNDSNTNQTPGRRPATLLVTIRTKKSSFFKILGSILRPISLFGVGICGSLGPPIRSKRFSGTAVAKSFVSVRPLSSSEFIRRFLMHALPSGFVRIRYYGFLANRYRNERLEKCRDLLGVTSVPTSTAEESPTPAENSDAPPSPNTCPACRRPSLAIIDIVPPTRPLSPRRPHFLIRRGVTSVSFDTS